MHYIQLTVRYSKSLVYMPHIFSKKGQIRGGAVTGYTQSFNSQPHYKFADRQVVFPASLDNIMAQSLLSLSDYMYPHRFLDMCHN